MNNTEQQYLFLIADIYDNGVKKQTRNGEVRSVFGRQIRHNFRYGFPLLTTKKMSLKNIFTELRWFLDGNTDIRYLWEHNCHIWDNDWYRWYCKKEGAIYSLEQMRMQDKDIPDEYYDLGFVYGHGWRKWGKDQVAMIINTLKTNPDDRRMLVSAWNVEQLDNCALPPCHYSWQVWTRELTIEERFVFFNKKHNEESKKIMKEKGIGKYTLVWFTKKYGDVEGEKKYNEKHKRDLINLEKAKITPRKSYICPNCGLKGVGGNMKRYHFDNCKKIPK